MKTCILVMLAIICLAGWSGAVEPTPEAVPDAQDVAEDVNPSPAVSLTTLSAEQVARLSPLHSEMRTILLSEQADVLALTARMADIPDRIAVLELQRQITDRKTRTQIELLAVQGRYARQEGRVEQADEAEKAAASLSEQLEVRAIEREE